MGYYKDLEVGVSLCRTAFTVPLYRYTVVQYYPSPPTPCCHRRAVPWLV